MKAYLLTGFFAVFLLTGCSSPGLYQPGEGKYGRKGDVPPAPKVMDKKKSKPASTSKKKTTDKSSSELPPPVIDKDPASGEGFEIVNEKNTKNGKTYVTEKGDSLSSIARKFYGDSKAWKKIYQANKDVIPNPDKLPVGITITIP